MTPDSQADLRRLLDNPAFPRASTYDPNWVADNTMGPNVLWLAESLSHVFEFKPGMRILDLGCGRALSSIFLAKEFGVQVWAADLWIKPTENLRRIEEAGVADQVFPIFVEAHQLPFAAGFFDVVVGLDWSFHGPEWWREHWDRTGLVQVEHADLVPDGWRHWLASDRATSPGPAFADQMPAWTAALEADAGRTFGFARVVARKLAVDLHTHPVWP